MNDPVIIPPDKEQLIEAVTIEPPPDIEQTPSLSANPEPET
ncbi:MAG TPA: hypothetical protein VEH56_00510 [Candidatus Saccharimonadales bacterium]|nr:hypothetical protein [Candidatus Saccharimonadales bacterium]